MRVSLSAKLLLAFSLMTMLTVLAAIAGWIGFENVAQTHRSVIDESIPTMTGAQQVAEITGQIIATAPLLASAQNQRDRSLATEHLENQKAILNRMLQTVGRDGLDREQAAKIRGALDQITENLTEQNELIKRRIILVRKRNVIITELNASLEQLTRLTKTLTANAMTAVTNATAGIGDLAIRLQGRESVQAALYDIVAVDLDTLDRYIEFHRASIVAQSLIGNARKEDDLLVINYLQNEYQINLDRLERGIGDVSDPSRKEEARPLLKIIKAAGQPNGDNNVFTIFRELQDLAAKLLRLQAANHNSMTHLNAVIGELIEESSQAIYLSMQHAEKSNSENRDNAIAISVVILIIVTPLILIYLRRRVVTRLSTIGRNMNKLAGGDFNIDLVAKGSDELSEMARNVEVFKKNALEKEGVERELQQHKANLEELVIQRTGELEEANQQIREEAARHVVARQTAEEANRAKTQFLAAMSHELRTPLSGILGTLNLLASTRTTAIQARYIKILNSTGRTLLDIINDILGYSEIESGQLKLDRREFNIRSLIFEMIELMRPSATEKNLRLDFSVSRDIPEYLAGDAAKLRQILLNLIGNSIKFTETGNVVLEVVASKTTAKNTISMLFKVIDTGIGIPREMQKSVFEAFTRFEPKSSRQLPGTGLGLAICNRLITAMGGSIECDSKLDSGTTISFILEFAIVKIPNEAPEQVLDNFKSVDPLEILLVEDDETNAMVINEYLKRDHHQVTPVNNGEHALELIKTHPFDLIIMDIRLPGINGVEATRKIRGLSSKKSDIPIVAMSAHVFNEDVKRFLEAGMNQFLGKPVDPAELRRVLYEMMTGIQPIHPPSSIAEKDDLLLTIDSCYQRLSQSAKDLGQAKMRKMVRLYRTSTKSSMATLDASVSSANWVDAGKSIHKIKGAAAVVGLEDFRALAEQLECAIQSNRSEISSLLSEFERTYESSYQHLLATEQQVMRQFDSNQP